MLKKKKKSRGKDVLRWQNRGTDYFNETNSILKAEGKISRRTQRSSYTTHLGISLA